MKDEATKVVLRGEHVIILVLSILLVMVSSYCISYFATSVGLRAELAVYKHPEYVKSVLEGN